MGDDVCTIDPEHWWRPRQPYWLLYGAAVLILASLGFWSWSLVNNLRRPEWSWFEIALDAIFVVALLLLLLWEWKFRRESWFRIAPEGLVVRGMVRGERIAIAWDKLEAIEWAPLSERLVLREKDGRKHRVTPSLYRDPFELRDALMAFAPEDVVTPKLPVYLRARKPSP